MLLTTKELNAPGLITAFDSILDNVFVTGDTLNDVTDFIVYRNSAASGKKVVQASSIPGDTELFCGFTQGGKDKIDCPDGIYVDWTGVGAPVVIVHYKEKRYMRRNPELD